MRAASVRGSAGVRGAASSGCSRCEARPVRGCVVGVGEARGVSCRRDVGSEYVGAWPSVPPMAVSPGAAAACFPFAEFPLKAATVRPPPTRAKAVATTARRWFFFQRAI
ncbi:hypothetical protein KEF29_01000 [Streptomyces tuirus]|uniref:Uncharacterized protein n=1 Tax=Streptomyces tuirus TaxID=68278 RepID=A0A941FE76_9ACTN|nr:hypothetical protein [Streptomyces tuirus]